MKVKKALYDLQFCIVNYVIAYIPCWTIRKALYRIMGMRIGRDSRINMHVYVYSPHKIRIGDSTIINERALLDGRGGLSIGDHCSVSYNAVIYSATHDIESPVFEGIKRETVIENGVWLCVNSVILPGSRIKENCVIAANSVMKGDTEKNTVYASGEGRARAIKGRNVTDVKMKVENFFR